MTDEQAGKLFKAVYQYQKVGEIVNDDQLTRIALNPFLNQFLRDEERYKNVVLRNKTNGLKGGRPRTQENPENPVGYLGTQKNPEEPKKADSKSDSDSKKDKEDIKDISKDISKKPTFKKPEISEIRNYCNEILANIDPDRFFDYYQANGWKVGKNPMRDWKAAIRNWKSKQSQNQSQPRQYQSPQQAKTEHNKAVLTAFIQDQQKKESEL